MNFRKIKTNSFIAVAKLTTRLPLGVILLFGKFIGFITWVIPNKRKNIATTNIALCYPELSKAQQAQLLKENLISTGIGFSEMMVAFWSHPDKYLDAFEINGIEHVEKALKQQKGCMLLSCHLHSIELVIKVINLKLSQPGYMLARQHNNKILESVIDQARKMHCEKTIDKKDIKMVLKSLKNNHPVYYVPDQNFSYQCQFIDFFKQPAATVDAPVRLAQSSETVVVPWFGFREKDTNGKTCWKISFLEPLSYFHENDINSSLSKMNRLFEEQINKHPEQYLWVHRRFKNHPKGRNFIYKDI